MQDSLSWSSRLEGGLHESGAISCQSEKVHIWWFWLQGIETPTKSWTLHPTFKSERLNMVDGFKSLTRCEPKNKKTREPFVGGISSCLSPLRTLYLFLLQYYFLNSLFSMQYWSNMFSPSINGLGSLQQNYIVKQPCLLDGHHSSVFFRCCNSSFAWAKPTSSTIYIHYV